MQATTKEITLTNGLVISIESGRMARQADGAIVLRCGDTMLLATVCGSKEPKDLPFLPLTVDYQEKFSGAGKIPGGFLKREGRLNDHEILTSRIVDRSVRPLFPEGYRYETQLMIQMLSSDGEVQPDALALVAASAALNISPLTFSEPVSSVRIGYKEGEYLVNPTVSEMEGAELDLMVSGTSANLNMVEGEMREVSEDVMVGALEIAHENIKLLNDLQRQMVEAVGEEKREFEGVAHNEDLKKRIEELASERINEIAHTHTYRKSERSEAFSALADEVAETLREENEEFDEDGSAELFDIYFKDLKRGLMRKMIVREKIRIDGRKPTDIRDIWTEVDVLPRAHGSSLFTRGETQALATVTFGSRLDEQMIDWATVSTYKKFMLQYRFPPFSTGEVKPVRGVSRREVGHGNLAERAVKNLVPEDNQYTLRVTSEVLESNGSSSMATVCASSLALMDAGIQMKKAVSGIAMGLIAEEGEFVILTDILGDEDALGDMDFKVTGTREGITACQMDIKVDGLPYDVLAQALEQARQARLHILDKMDESIAEPREDYKPHAPRMVRIEIPADDIGAVIGKGGEVVQALQKETGTTITIDEDEEKEIGIVSISSEDKASIEEAHNRVLRIIEKPEVGKVYNGKVVNIRESGAFIEILPGKDAYLHISEVAWEHIPDIESVLSKGDIVEVEYLGIDKRSGKPRVSRKKLLPKPENYTPPKRGGGGGGGRDGNRRGGGGGNRRGGNRGGGGGGRHRRNDN